jgi:hypothetical protein
MIEGNNGAGSTPTRLRASKTAWFLSVRHHCTDRKIKPGPNATIIKPTIT